MDIYLTDIFERKLRGFGDREPDKPRSGKTLKNFFCSVLPRDHTDPATHVYTQPIE
jgi:hypothetical protein